MKPSKIALGFILQSISRRGASSLQRFCRLGNTRGTQGDGSVVLLKFSDYVKPNAC